MLMTILEAHVPGDRWAELQQTYGDATAHLDEGITQTFLIQAVSDATLWRIVTVWRDRAALEAMRKSGQIPRGVLIFRAAGAEPALTVFEVAAHAAI